MREEGLTTMAANAALVATVGRNIGVSDDIMIILANDDGKKMVEREGAERFAAEYTRLTGIELELIAAGERPDFVCEKSRRRYGLELVGAMRDPIQRDRKSVVRERV